MTRRNQDDIILVCAAFGLLLGLIAFLKVMVSPPSSQASVSAPPGGIGAWAA